MSYARLLIVAPLVSAATSFAHADEVLAGSDLSNASNGGAVLCAIADNCDIIAQAFTVSASVAINNIVVSLSGPADGLSPGIFNLSLIAQLGGPPIAEVGSGELAFAQGPYPPIRSEDFAFENLNILLGPGTYYLELSNSTVEGRDGNLEWNYAPPLLTPDGFTGSDFSCDPFENCAPGRWDSPHTAEPHAMEIDGSIVRLSLRL